MWRQKKCVSPLFAALFLAFLFVIPVLAEDTVNIVHLDPLSGPFKDMGDYALMGVQFAVDEINAAGGLLGKQIKLLPEDNQLKPDVAVRKATKAIWQDNAKFISQLNSTAVARALMDVALKEKVIFVTHGGVSDYLGGKDFNRYYFRVCSTTRNISKAYVQFFKTKSWRKFYLLNMDYVFGHAVAEEFLSEAKKEIPDLRILGEDYHPLATKDFGPYISKIISSGAEVVFTGNYGPDLHVLMKQGAQMGLKARYATYFLDDDKDLAMIGEAAVGSIVVCMYLPTVDTPENKMFLNKWHKKYKETSRPWPTATAGRSYNGTMFFFDAIKKAGSFDTESIIKAWEGMERNGLIGKQIMRPCDHQTLQPVLLAEIQAKSELFPFPFAGRPITIPIEKVLVPPEETGNSRCR